MAGWQCLKREKREEFLSPVWGSWALSVNPAHPRLHSIMLWLIVRVVSNSFHLKAALPTSPLVEDCELCLKLLFSCEDFFGIILCLLSCCAQWIEREREKELLMSDLNTTTFCLWNPTCYSPGKSHDINTSVTILQNNVHHYHHNDINKWMFSLNLHLWTKVLGHPLEMNSFSIPVNFSLCRVRFYSNMTLSLCTKQD